MRPTPKISVRLVAISFSCVGLIFLFGNSVWTQETKKTNPRINELQQQRLVTLEKISDSAKKLFAHARVSFEEARDAEATLLAAQLESAQTRNDRIKACDESIRQALEWQKITKTMKEGARGTELTVLKAEAFLIDCQIAREKAETGE